MITVPPAIASNTQMPPRHWALLIAWATILALILSLWAINDHTAKIGSSPDVQWGEARRTMLPDGETHVLRSLPDHWKAQIGRSTGTASYQLPFRLNEASYDDHLTHGWSLMINAISQEHRVLLNGRLIQDARTAPDALGDAAPALINIPGGAMRPGDNVLEIQVQARSRGGLGTPVLAPRSDLIRAFQFNRAITVFLPLMMNLTGATFAVFFIALWRARPREHAAGLFGVLSLVEAARNCFYYLPNELNLPHAVSSWLYFAVHVWGACMLGMFILALTNAHAPRLKQMFVGVMVTFPLVAAGTAWVDNDLRATRNLLQPVLIVIVFPSLWLMWRHIRSQPAASLTGLLGGLALIAGAGIHDYIGARVIEHPSFMFWMPWAIPLATPGFAMFLIRRIVHAFNEMEHLNQSLEHQVTERTHELAQANLAKSRFLATASHDLRQPVAAIGLMTELLRSKMTDPEQRHLTNQLSSAVVSMETQLRGLLDLSRLDTGDVVVRPQTVALRPLLRAIQGHEQMTAQAKGLQLRVHAPKRMSQRDLHAWADPVLLEQVLRNLVGNAVRHTRHGGVLIGVRSRDGGLRIDVWDTGPGIAPADQQRIFDEFVQIADGVGGGGLGLGLAIARRAATLMNARLTLRSRQGRGSCFSLYVPHGALAIQRRPAPSPGNTETAGAATSSGTTNRLALLVEDEAPLRLALSLSLEQWGWEVEAHESIESLTSRTGAPWRVLITDYRLPDGLGGDVLKWARERNPAAPAIVITGDTAPQRLRELDALGVPVLHKPFRPEQLQNLVTRVLTPEVRPQP